MLKTITASEFETIIGLGAEKWLDDEIDVMTNLDVSEFTLSDKMERHIRSSIQRNSRKEKWTPVFHCAKIAGIILVSVISILFAAAMMIQPVRAAFFDAIVQWYDDYIAIRFVPEEDVPTKIEEVKYPTYLPKGWQIELNYQGIGGADYKIVNQKGDIVIYIEQSPHNQVDEIWFDNTDAEITEILLNKQYSAQLITYNDGNYALTWNNIYNYYLISYQCDLELVLRIAESIQ
jgi:hypothetical protein